MTSKAIWIVAGLCALLPLVAPQPCEARDPRPYCMQGGLGSNGGLPDCVYYTMEQCLAAVAGSEGICSINPALGWRGQAPPPAQHPPPRRSRPRS